jgi:hypothetical protein
VSIAHDARPRVCVVTTHWSEGDDEETFATRSIAGALSRVANVEIVHMAAPPTENTVYEDSVFRVHRVALRGARPLRAALLRAALGTFDRTRLPGPTAEIIASYAGSAPEVETVLADLAPDAIILAGAHQPWDLSTLGAPGARSARVVALPFLADLARLREPAAAGVLAAADVVGVLHPGEHAAVKTATGRPDDEVVPVDLGFALNRSATTQRLFGVRFFGRYILLLRRFPPDGARFERVVTHEVLRDVLEDRVSVAEVDGNVWRVADAENTLVLPVNPTRVNLWRLMAHATFTVDLRPPGVVGREAIESMLFGTPVIAAEGSAAMAHVAAADGGLWYRDAGELLDASRVLMDRSLRERLSTQASVYAEAHHGQMDDFVTRTARLVLGAEALRPAGLGPRQPG